MVMMTGPAIRSTTRPADVAQWFLSRGDFAAVSVVRRAMTAWLRERGPRTGDPDAAELVIGEILANAVEHTGGPVWVSLTWGGRHPRMRVTDTGSGEEGTPDADPHLPEDELAESGRGLALATMLALDLSVSRSETDGAVVTATLDLGR